MAMNPAMLALIKGAKNKYSRSQTNTVKIKEGKTTVRILPYSTRENGQFWAELGVHWIKTDRNGKPVAVVGCHNEVHNAECPVCNAIEKSIKSATDDESLATYKEWKTKRGVLFNALIRSGTDASEDQAQILELTGTTAGKILNMIEEYALSDIDLTDLKEGMDFIVERKGKGFETEYTVMPAPKSKPVNKAALETCHDLDAYIAKEFFRGDETKALNAISDMSGVAVAIGGTRAAGLLTGKSASVEDDMDLEKHEPKVAPKAAPKKVAAVVDDEDESDPLPPAKPAKAAAAAKPAAKKEETELDDEDVNSLLSELDDL